MWLWASIMTGEGRGRGRGCRRSGGKERLGWREPSEQGWGGTVQPCTFLPRHGVPPPRSHVDTAAFPPLPLLCNCFLIVVKSPVSSISQTRWLGTTETHTLIALKALSPNCRPVLLPEDAPGEDPSLPPPSSGAASIPCLHGSNLCLRATCPFHLLRVHVPLMSLLQGCTWRPLGSTQITTHGSLLT